MKRHSRKLGCLFFAKNKEGQTLFFCFCVIFFGGVAGVSPAEGVADKQQSGENRHCLQGRFLERLAWETGEGFPLQKY